MSWTKMLVPVLVIVISFPFEPGKAQSGIEKTYENAIVYRPADQGGPRRFEVTLNGQLVLHKKPSIHAHQISSVTKGTILSNRGCEDLAEQVWCQVQLLRRKTRGFVLAEFLIPATGPDGVTPTGADDSAKRAGKGKFDASELIQCAQVSGQSMADCSIRISRSDGGDATAVVTFSNDFKRTLYFAHGIFVSANATMSGVGTDTDWQLKDGVHYIRVDDQRYEIPDALILDRLSVNKTE